MQVHNYNMGYSSTHSLLVIDLQMMADPVQTQILTPVSGQCTNSVVHCESLAVSGLGSKERHQRGRGEFLPNPAEIFSHDTTLPCVCAINM